MTLQLTAEEIERYRPYHTFPEFSIGFDEYMAGTMQPSGGDSDSTGGQAYDRGAECAMRRQGIPCNREGCEVLKRPSGTHRCGRCHELI